MSREELGLSKLEQGTYGGEWLGEGEETDSICPFTGKPLGTVRKTRREEYARVISAARAEFLRWRSADHTRILLARGLSPRAQWLAREGTNGVGFFPLAQPLS